MAVLNEGWVEQGSAPGDRGQIRKQYRITASGRKHLLEQLGRFGDREAADDEAFLFRVAFFGALPKSTRRKILAARASFLVSRSEQLSRLREIMKPRTFSAVALDRVRKLVKDELDWVHRLQVRVEHGKGA
jgi:DNA-binding PadR family transcriptional regulator